MARHVMCIMLLAIVVALASATRPKFEAYLGHVGMRLPPQAAGTVQTGDVAHEYHHVAASGRAIHLTYTGTLADDGVISLDDDTRIEKVLCEADQETVMIMTAKGVAATEISYPVGALLVGGVEWDCRNPDGSRGTLLRRVVSVSTVSDQTVKIATTRARYHHVFKHLSMKFAGNQFPAATHVAETASRRKAQEGAQDIKAATGTWHVAHSDGTDAASSGGARRLGFFHWISHAVHDIGHAIGSAVHAIGNAAKTVYNAGKLLVTGKASYDHSTSLGAINWNFDPSTGGSAGQVFDIHGDGASVSAKCTGCHVYADLMLHIQVEISHYSLQLATATLEGAADISVQGDIQADYHVTESGSRSVFTIHLPAITLPVPVPVVVLMSVPISVGYSVDLTASAGFQVSVHSKGSLTYGFEYTHDDGLQWVHKNQMQHIAPPTAEYNINLSADLWVMPQLQLSIDKIASASVDVKPMLKLDVDIRNDPTGCPNSAPEDYDTVVDVDLTWGVNVGTQAHIGIDILGFHLWSKTWGPDTLPLASGVLDDKCYFPGAHSAQPSAGAAGSVAGSVAQHTSSGYSAGVQPASPRQQDDDYYNQPAPAYYYTDDAGVGNDDEGFDRRLTATTTTDSSAPVSTSTTVVTGPKLCASKCMVASGLKTCSWLNGQSVCSGMSLTELQELDASIATSASAWKAEGPQCVDSIVPYLCSLHMPVCGAQSGSTSEIKSVSRETCVASYGRCGASNATATALCDSCASNRYCAVAANQHHALVADPPASDPLGACTTINKADASFCSHKVGRKAYLRTELYASVSDADAAAKALVGVSVSSVSECMQAVKLIACEMMLPDCDTSSTKATPAPLCMDTCVSAMASCASDAEAQQWCDANMLKKGYASTTSTCGMRDFQPAAVTLGATSLAAKTPSQPFAWAAAAIGSGATVAVALLAGAVGMLVLRARRRRAWNTLQSQPVTSEVAVVANPIATGPVDPVSPSKDETVAVDMA